MTKRSGNAPERPAKQHAAMGRDREIARQLSKMAENEAMSRCIILCDCGMPPQQQFRVSHEQQHDERHVVALIDDYRPHRPLKVEQNVLESFASRAVKPNRRGDTRSPFSLRCAGCGKPQLLRLATIAAVVDTIAPAAKSLECVEFYDRNAPATDEDEELALEQFVVDDLGGGTYTGPKPVWVPVTVRRHVIPWWLFKDVVASLKPGKR
ncbi:hypothetical protein [Mycobacterium sp. OTB74]|uniref:hypothetical protein n=1 Tax=Mycobacterium sp. OTB74 TaxID=1853452 RepID=UPI002474D097|nr:hypothetical protein [Mycobacterium sp. OTB74]MDH6247549.1 hypothetical protein [Mycobacterium sp. OTB74]